MRLSQLSIKNYRSIREILIDCSRLVTLLGPNNHGKSNVLGALEFALSTSAKPTDADFCSLREADDNELWVELTFSNLNDQEQHTFKRYLLANQTIRIRKIACLQNNNIDVSYHGWLEQPEEPWLCAERAAEYTNRDRINATPLRELVPESGRLVKTQIETAQADYILRHHAELQFSCSLESGPLFGQKNVAGGILPELYLVPAIRDLTDEIKFRTTTTFGRLLSRAVREMAQRDTRFQEARSQLQSVIASLNQREDGGDSTNELALLESRIEAELQSWRVNVQIEVTQPDIERLFELGTDIHIDDGVRTTADRKGHGLQRAMIFALLRAWAAALRNSKKSADASDVLAPRKQSDSVIFAIEEPELFLHPHAQRKFALSLRELSEAPDHQVFLCTHSTHFVDLAHYKEIVIIRKDDAKGDTRVRQCTSELFEGAGLEDRKRRFRMAKWINPDRGEIFFARRAILVEGETEKVIIPFIAHKIGCFDAEVSVIDCGAKHNLPLYIEIMKAFRISYRVVHDEDPLPNPVPPDWEENTRREKKRTFELNDEIAKLVSAPDGVEMFRPDFEGACGISRTQGDKKGKALAALEYYDGIPENEIPDVLRSIVSACYSPVQNEFTLSDRENGGMKGIEAVIPARGL